MKARKKAFLSVRRFYQIYGSFHWLFIVILALFMAEPFLVPGQCCGDEPSWVGVVMVALILAAIVLVTGTGVLFLIKRLYLGCPVCDAPSQVTALGEYSMEIECPRCSWLGIEVEKRRIVNIVREEDLDEPPPP